MNRGPESPFARPQWVLAKLAAGCRGSPPPAGPGEPRLPSPRPEPGLPRSLGSRGLPRPVAFRALPGLLDPRGAPCPARAQPRARTDRLGRSPLLRGQVRARAAGARAARSAGMRRPVTCSARGARLGAAGEAQGWTRAGASGGSGPGRAFRGPLQQYGPGAEKGARLQLVLDLNNATGPSMVIVSAAGNESLLSPGLARQLRPGSGSS